MTTLRCQDCGLKIDGKRSDVDELECDCGGSYAVLNSEDDGFEAEQCSHCNKDIVGEDIDNTYTCDECGDDTICEKCMVMQLENVSVCKKCVDDAYPRKDAEVETQYVDRIVEKEVKVYVDKEGVPLNTSYDPTKKSRFE